MVLTGLILTTGDLNTCVSDTDGDIRLSVEFRYSISENTDVTNHTLTNDCLETIHSLYIELKL